MARLTATDTTRHNSGARPGSWAAFVPLALTLGVFAIYFVIMLAYARALLLFPFDYDQGEGFELYDAIRLARFENIYLDNAQFPYYSSNYPPVYRVLLVPLVWLFGPQMWVARLLAFVCTLGVGALIYGITRRVWRGADADWRLTLAVPLLAALAFFAANFVYHVAPLARAHLPMVLFALAGIACLERAFDAQQGGPNPRWAAVGVTLLMTAGFTKLQAVDALAAGFAYLLLRHPRWFVQALLGCAAATAVLVLWLNIASAGQFWLNVVSANVNEYDIAVTWKTYGQWFQTQGVLIVCSVIYVVWDIVNAVRARSFKPITIWSLYFVTGSALGMLTGKWGAGPTYLVAAIAASCVCTAALLARLAGDSRQKSEDDGQKTADGGRITEDGERNGGHGPLSSVRRLPSAVLCLLTAAIFLGQAVLNVHLPTSGRVFGVLARVIGVADLPSSYPPYPYYDSVGYTQLGHLLDRMDTQHGWDLVEELKKHPGPVWSEEAMFTLHAGKDVVTNPTQLLNLSKNGMLDTRDMIARIDRREFGAVIFRAWFYPDDVKEAIARNYRIVGSIKINGFDYYLLLPKPAG